MPALSAAQRDAIAKLLDDGAVALAWAKLEAFPDLKQTDLPVLEKGTIARLGADAVASRAFAAGLVWPSISVRRMARKYAPKLAPEGPGAILRLLVECVRPLRKLAKGEVGLAGDFGGYATPLGPAVLGAGLSFEVANPNVQVYSPATKLMKEALEDLAAAVAMSPDSTLVRAHEYLLAICRPFAMVEAAPLAQDVPALPTTFAALALRDALQLEVGKRAAKGEPALLAALERWCRQELVLDDEAPEGTAEAALRARFRELPEAERRVSAGAVAVGATYFLEGLPAPLGLAAWWRLKAGPPGATPALVRLLEMTTKGFARRHESETAGAVPSPLPALAPEGAAALLAPVTESKPSKKPAKKAKAAAPVAPPAEVPPRPGPLHPFEGPDPATCRNALFALARAFGLGALWTRMVDELGYSWAKRDTPPAPAGAPADAEATVAAALDFVGKATRKSPDRERLLREFHGRSSGFSDSYVPEADLAAAPWADRLGELVASLDSPEVRLQAALALLPPRALERHADAWREAASRLDDDMKTIRVRERVASVLHDRGVAIAAALEPAISAHARRFPPNGCVEWELAIALLAEDPATRAAAARIVAAAKLPEAKGPYARHCFKSAYRTAFRRAWERRDADLLGAAFSRLCVPLYFKGKKAFVPAEEPLRRDDYAPSEGKPPLEGELPLGVVLAFVARERKEALAAGVAAAGAIASFDKGARAILDAAIAEPAAKAAIEAQLDQVMGLIEAPDPSAVKSGLELVAGLAPLLESRLDGVMAAVERSVASTSPGVLQAASALLGVLGEEYPDRAPDALRLLEECLASSNVPTAEEALRALGRLVGGKKKLALSKAARKRVEQLAAAEPKRLGKLAKGLL